MPRPPYRRTAYPRTLLNPGRATSVNPKAILFCRLIQRWSQADLAIYIGVTERTIYSWEHGRFEPNLDNAIELRLWINKTKKQLTAGHHQLSPKAATLLERRPD